MELREIDWTVIIVGALLGVFVFAGYTAESVKSVQYNIRAYSAIHDVVREEGVGTFTKKCIMKGNNEVFEIQCNSEGCVRKEE